MGRCSCINMQEYKWNMKRNQECVNSPLHPLSKLSPLSDPTITSPIDALPPLILSSGQPSSCCRIRIISFPQLLPCLLPLHDTPFLLHLHALLSPPWRTTSALAACNPLVKSSRRGRNQVEGRWNQATWIP
jgi:hypothetical protein